MTDVALEPSDGPLPPPIKVVVPLETDRRVYRHETSTTSGTSSTLALIVGIAWLTL